MRWQYRVVKWGSLNDEYRTVYFLNDEGSVGWELVSIRVYDENSANFYFKRPIHEKPSADVPDFLRDLIGGK